MALRQVVIDITSDMITVDLLFHYLQCSPKAKTCTYFYMHITIRMRQIPLAIISRGIIFFVFRRRVRSVVEHSSANSKVRVRFRARSHTGVTDYDEACKMHLTPGVVHNFPKAVGVYDFCPLCTKKSQIPIRKKKVATPGILVSHLNNRW